MNCTKIILSSYANFDRAIKAAEKRIRSKSEYSFNDKRPCEKIVEEILDLMCKKNKIIGLKKKVDLVFSTLDHIEKDLLNCKYLDKKPNNKFCFSLRTYFRKQAALEKKLDIYFSYVGLNDKDFFEYFKDVPFILCAKIKVENVKRLKCAFFENADEDARLKRKTA